ncbi:hypothetical protein V6Z11_D11G165000 [Gossypium hirsutum]
MIFFDIFIKNAARKSNQNPAHSQNLVTRSLLPLLLISVVRPKSPNKSVEIPKFVDTVTPQFKPKFDALLVELKEVEEKSLKESERLEKEIADFQELKQKISTMTADEYFEKHPELKKKFDDEFRNDNWGY